MRIDIATLFPDMCKAVFGESIVGRGIKNGFLEVYAHNIRDYTADKHKKVDDTPYGGGTGLLMRAQPIYDCVEAIKKHHEKTPRVIYLSPKGEPLTQKKVAELAKESGLILICGHYEGVDERVLEELRAEEISVGDYVLTGGELPALIITDAVARLQSGVLPNEEAYSIESHYNGLLEFPQYTMPEVWKNRKVPEILLSGDHKKIAEWRKKMSADVTKKKRPDMFEAYLKAEIKSFLNAYKTASGDAFRKKPALYFANAETVKAIKRGKQRELFGKFSENRRVIIIDELQKPRFLLQITKAEENSAKFRIIYKN